NLMARDVNGDYANALGQNAQINPHMEHSGGGGAGTGAGIGAVLGGLGGLLVGLGALAIPGIGPVLAAGPIITTLAGAGVGAVTGGIIGALAELGIPEEHANLYAEGIRRGGTLVAVRASDETADRARMLMNRFNPVDIENRSQNWRKEQWQGFDQQGQPLSAERMEFNRDAYMTNAGVNATPDVNMPQQGGYDPRTSDAKIRAERESGDYHSGESTGVEDASRHLNEDIYSKERVTDENLVDIPVTGTTTPEYVHDAREDANQLPIDTEDYGTFDQDFHMHYQSRYAASGMPYVNYQPAYQYGYFLASDPQFEGYEWERVEPLAQEQWRRRGMRGTWDDVKDAVHHAWHSVTHRL
ncbi:MAG TPA: hypothetical protein VF806_07175, partial [Anaerolineaceae bacterium]